MVEAQIFSPIFFKAFLSGPDCHINENQAHLQRCVCVCVCACVCTVCTLS
uniref:Uncharacterized protein n=1 Tax=Anguilla anguilla TaxID=7936 RepID=A0A0E9SIH2_ANGAN